ncbi:NAD-dependent epimerase/dehydratase family protein [Vulcanisaeta souniana]|uniref:Thymidine diphosphoglucose 4,6-dehydratase n=1 Tax=Vulcanisaeta souniana JCM 11219 TaxID=1293586 RepID=A0A830E6B6_9CREN|nr:NAD(P)-dependent oxidoreductase [Vulcanisaeta souniana]BDR93552.1 thymidine diphosphoglucose 4,6-dehydratase [Vulcanisaeta souniana JCM 11219]GGI87426.1 thymidine diphosphoglucose 4,6-dehydratase [Vulcanisaeta souniana JCM 11219]
MSVLVTGASGQIGRFVIDELLSRGYDVVAFDVRFDPYLVSKSKSNDKLKLVSGDITDIEEVLNAVKKYNTKRIIHLAALVLFESRIRPLKAIKVNILGALNMFEVARLMDLERVVYASSEAVLGSPSDYSLKVVNEDVHPLTPPEPYSITKFVDESFGVFYRDVYNVDVVGARLTSVWGPGRYTGYTGQFNNFLRELILKGSAKVPEDFAYTEAKLRWLYVRDGARAFAHVALVDKAKVRRSIYNIGSGSSWNVINMLNVIKEVLPNAKVDFTPLSKPTENSSKIPGPAGLDVDCSRLYNELGFEEKYGLKGGLLDMINYVMNYEK